MNRPKTDKGFSLAELMITLGLLMLLTTSLFGTLTLGMRYYRQSHYSTDLQKAVRDCVENMTDEIRQAVPDEDPGMLGNPPTGYKSISPAIASNGILFPNVNNHDTDYVIFTKPDYDYFDPGNSLWEPFDPRNYKKVRYYIRNTNEMVREVSTFQADGTIKEKITETLAVVPDGKLQMECLISKSGNAPSYYFTITAIRNETSYTLSSGCLIPGSVY